MDHKDPEFFIKLNHDVRTDMYHLIEAYLNSFPDVDNEKNLLYVLGAMQATLFNLYKEGLGPRETSELYYKFADDMVADMVNKSLKRNNYKGPKV